MPGHTHRTFLWNSECQDELSVAPGSPPRSADPAVFGSDILGGMQAYILEPQRSWDSIFRSSMRFQWQLKEGEKTLQQDIFWCRQPERFATLWSRVVYNSMPRSERMGHSPSNIKQLMWPSLGAPTSVPGMRWHFPVIPSCSTNTR